ncbi:MAG: AAA family ATPase [Gammaproteobacteria bacterium]
MRHIMVINAKGGSGKTTIATNLASYFASQNKNVTIIDYDPQGSSLDWLAARSLAKQPIHGIAGFKQKAEKPGRKTDIVIMDVPAALHGAELTALVRKAQTIIIPILPSPIDMRAATQFLTELKKCAPVSQKKAKLALVANRAREITNIAWELEEYLSKQKIPYLTMLRDNQNYVRAAERGLGIFEMGPAATAVDRDQWEPILKWIKSKRSQP